MTKVFISYSNKDKPFARRLAHALQEKRYEVWIDEAEVAPGDSLISAIEHGFESSDYLAIVLSPDALQSRWVREEVQAALVDCIAGKKLGVIPVLYRDCDIPPFLRSRVWIDFRDSDEDEQRFSARINLLITHISQTPPRETIEPTSKMVVSKRRDTIRATILIVTDGTTYDVEMPADSLVKYLIPALVKELDLPTKFADGRAVEYELYSKTKGCRLLSHLTLRQNGVTDGNVFRLMVEMVAG